LLRTVRTESRDAGFTLIEVLVALSVMAIMLAAIGSVMAMNARGTRALDQRLALIETARAVETGLPSRAELVPGSFSGERAGHRWRVDVLPFGVVNVDPQAVTPWVPARVVIRVQGPSGSILQVETVRLRRGTGG
jgi:general secretion pathway protein I